MPDAKTGPIVRADAEAYLEGCSLFNSRAFHALHPRDRQFYFTLHDPDRGVVGASHFSEIEPGVFRSPARGMFGGIDLAEREIELCRAFVAGIEDRLRAVGARRLRMRLAPFAHDPVKGALVAHCLFERGWTVASSELDFCLTIDSRELIARLNQSRRRRVRVARKAGFGTRRMSNDELDAAYAVVARNRDARGFDLSMSLEQVQEMVDAFPDRMRLYGTDKAGELAAAAICLAIDARILYVYAWGHDPRHHDYSPVMTMANDIHELAREEGFELLDLGTVPNESGDGLRRFKEALGGEASLILELEKVLDEERE